MRIEEDKDRSQRRGRRIKGPERRKEGSEERLSKGEKRGQKRKRKRSGAGEMRRTGNK